jgi:hypothetical protein
LFTDTRSPTTTSHSEEKDTYHRTNRCVRITRGGAVVHCEHPSKDDGAGLADCSHGALLRRQQKVQESVEQRPNALFDLQNENQALLRPIARDVKKAYGQGLGSERIARVDKLGVGQENCRPSKNMRSAYKPRRKDAYRVQGQDLFAENDVGKHPTAVRLREGSHL